MARGPGASSRTHTLERPETSEEREVPRVLRAGYNVRWGRGPHIVTRGEKDATVRPPVRTCVEDGRVGDVESCSVCTPSTRRTRPRRRRTGPTSGRRHEKGPDTSQNETVLPHRGGTTGRQNLPGAPPQRTRDSQMSLRKLQTSGRKLGIPSVPDHPPPLSMVQVEMGSPTQPVGPRDPVRRRRVPPVT